MEKKSYLKFSSGIYNIFFLLILSISAILIIYTFQYIHFASQADEGYYLRCSTYISEKGISGFPDLFKVYFANPEHRITQNPLRVGYIILASIWLKIFGSSFINLAFMSLFFYCAFLVISFSFIKRYFNDKIAVLTSILLAFSPLNMAMARRVLVDSAVNMFIILAIWIFFENLKNRKTYKSILFIVIYAFTILIKEGSVLLSVFFLLYLLVHKYIFKKSIRWLEFLIEIFFSLSVVGIIYAILAGGLGPFIKAAISVLTSPQINAYAILFCAGPWFRYIIDFVLLSPWVSILAIGFSLNYVLRGEWREEIIYLLLFTVCLLFLYTFLIKNIRYLISLDVPMRLFAVLMLNELANRISKNKASTILFVSVIAISFIDCSTFFYLFVMHGIYDPVSCWLLQAFRIIPWK